MTNGFRAQRHPEDIHPYSLETPLHTRLWHNPHNSFAAMESRVWIHPPRLIDRMDKGKVHGNSFKPNKMNIRNQWCFIQTAPAYRNREESPPHTKYAKGNSPLLLRQKFSGTRADARLCLLRGTGLSVGSPKKFPPPIDTQFKFSFEFEPQSLEDPFETDIINRVLLLLINFVKFLYLVFFKHTICLREC